MAKEGPSPYIFKTFRESGLLNVLSMLHKRFAHVEETFCSRTLEKRFQGIFRTFRANRSGTFGTKRFKYVGHPWLCRRCTVRWHLHFLPCNSGQTVDLDSSKEYIQECPPLYISVTVSIISGNGRSRMRTVLENFDEDMELVVFEYAKITSKENQDLLDGRLKKWWKCGGRSVQSCTSRPKMAGARPQLRTRASGSAPFIHQRLRIPHSSALQKFLFSCERNLLDIVSLHWMHWKLAAICRTSQPPPPSTDQRSTTQRNSADPALSKAL